jgi:hypothetical protein
LRISVGKKKESTKTSKLERQFIGLLTEHLRVKRTVYQVETSNVVSFQFRTDVLGKCGNATCRVGIFAKTIVFMVRTGIPSPEPDCMKCLNSYTTAVNSLYCRDWDRVIGRVWFHTGVMIYQLIHLCGRRDAVDQALVRELINTAIREVRRFHEAAQESGFLEHCEEVHQKRLRNNGTEKSENRKSPVAEKDLQDKSHSGGTSPRQV